MNYYGVGKEWDGSVCADMKKLLRHIIKGKKPGTEQYV